MLKFSTSLTVMVFLFLTVLSYAAPLKPRIIVLTDISPVSVEPDDMESMIRLLAHADLFEIEGLIATTGWSNGGSPDPWIDSIYSVINAYEKDIANLRKRSNQTGHLSDESKQEIGYWPSAAYLRSRTMMGSKKMGYSYIGAGNNSPGSDHILKMADENDDRPVWVTVWGGGNTLAQALWRAQQERTAGQLEALLRKLRVYTITDQDKPYGSTVAFSISSHQSMRRQFPQILLFIWDECAWLYQNSTGVNRWTEYATHIQNHGNLGALYPKYRWGVEGDTPSFLYLMPTGLNDPDIPTQGSWGGYFVWAISPDTLTYAYTNYQGIPAFTTSTEYQNHFYQATFNNFAARMDWAKEGTGNRNPVVVVNNDSSMAILTMRPLQGTSVTLDGSSSYDPDGDNLTFKWWTMPAAGTYTQAVTIPNAGSNRVTLSVPADAAGKSIHVIGEVTDDGVHPLTGYRRIVVEPVSQVSVQYRPPVPRTRFGLKVEGGACFDVTGRRLLPDRHVALTAGVVLWRDREQRVRRVLRMKY